MDNKSHIILTLSFLFICACVGILQAVAELSDGKSIQAFHPLEDTFITPIKNGKEINKQLENLAAVFDKLGVELKKGRQLASDTSEEWDSYPAVELSDEALIIVGKTLKKFSTGVNRHLDIPDSEIDTLEARLTAFYNHVSDDVEPGALFTEYESLKQIIHTFSENRRFKITSYPALVFKTFFKYTFFSRKYLRGYESDMEDNSLFANAIRPVFQVIWYAIFNDLGDKALQGSNGWLFFKPGVEFLTRPYILDKRSKVVDPEDKPITDNAIDTIVAFQKELVKHGVELLVVIVPGKASIYADLMSNRIKTDEVDIPSHSYRILSELNERGVATVNLFDVFKKARKNDAIHGDSLYLARDTHWKTRGPRIAATAVAERVEQYSWFGQLKNKSVEYQIDTVTVSRDGDIGVMTKLPEFMLRGMKLNFPLEDAKCYQVFEIVRGEDSSVVSRKLYHVAHQKKYRRTRAADIMVIGDSFTRMYQTDAPGSAGWVSHLAFELSQPISYIFSNGGASTLVRERLARNKKALNGKKLLIWEFVERDLRYGAEGWKNIKL